MRCRPPSGSAARLQSPAHGHWRWPHPEGAWQRQESSMARQRMQEQAARKAAAARWLRANHESVSSRLLLQAHQFCEQVGFALRMYRIRVDAFNRADDDALRFVVMTDALRAARRVDDIDRLALRNRLVGADRFADIAVDANLGDTKRHQDSADAGMPASACGRYLASTNT